MKNRILFCDTNILRELIDHPEKWTSFYGHLSRTQAILAISVIQVVELTKLPRYLEALSNLLVGTRFTVIKFWRLILQEEIELYPETAQADPLMKPLLSEQLLGTSGQGALNTIFRAKEFEFVWRVMDEQKESYMKVMSWLSKTAPKPTADKDLDFSLHNYGVVVGELREAAPLFLDSFKGEPHKLSPELFCGLYLRAAYIYFRYILKGKGKKPEPSDIGDVHQVFYLPYCHEVILEKSMGDILHQLKRDKGLLPETEIRAISFIRELPNS